MHTENLHLNYEDPAPHEVLDEVVVALKEQAENPYRPDTDVYISAFCDAAYSEMMSTMGSNDPSTLYELIRFAAWERENMDRPLDGQTLSKLLFRAFHKQVLRKMETIDRDEELYPVYPSDAYTDPHTWQVIINTVLKNQEDDISYDEINHDLMMRDVQSNVPSRARGIGLVLHSEYLQYGHTPSLLEVGASDMLIQRQLVHGNMGDMSVLKSFRDVNKAEFTKTALVNQILKQKIPLSPGVGIDQYDPVKDPTVVEWIRTNSLRPTEYLKQDIVQHWNNLHNISLAQHDLHFVWSTFKPENQREITELLEEKNLPSSFDVVTLPTVLYMQPTPNKRIEMEQLAADFVTKSYKTRDKTPKMLVELDFARQSSKDPSRLHYYKEWGEKGRYRLHIRFADEGFETPHEIFRFGGGRCRDMVLGRSASKLAIGQRLQSFAD